MSNKVRILSLVSIFLLAGKAMAGIDFPSAASSESSIELISLGEKTFGILVQVKEEFPNGTVLVRTVEREELDAPQTFGSEVPRRGFKEFLVDHVAIMPVVGYTGLLGLNGGLSIVIGETTGGHVSGMAGLMIGAAYGTHGNEVSIGYGEIGFVGGEIGMSFVRSAGENYMGFKGKMTFAFLQLQAGIYADSHFEALPVFGVGAVLPISFSFLR